MITKEEFGTVLKNDNEEKAYKYTLTNKNEMSLTVTDVGASIVSILVPDKDNYLVDVVLGFETAEEYVENDGPAFGATVGRNANRIEGAICEIEDVLYHLDQNDGHNNLHSGFHKSYTRLWDVKKVDESENEIIFSLFMKDGDQGFPGNFDIDVSYKLTEDNEVIIDYRGKCDQTTIANFTNHCYFNLNGHDQGDILDHYLKMYARMFTPFKDTINIPSGEIRAVTETPFDFQQFKRIGKEINRPHKQLKVARGYDHNFVIENTKRELVKAAEVYSNKTKILMEVYTDLEGMQLYTGNFLDGTLKGKDNCYYERRAGFCLETQHFPNAINTESFKSPILEAGQPYHTTTIYQFKLKD